MDFTIDITSYRSPNYDTRHQPISALLLHSDEGTAGSSLSWLCLPASQVSSGYYVTRLGGIFQLVDDHNRAWHAGVGVYAGIADWNSASIGIECEHRQGQDWPMLQLDALSWLCRAKIAQYGIVQSRVAAHRWVAQPPGRKHDPTDWNDLALRQWIASLYAPSRPPPTPPPAADFAEWGQVAYNPTFGIPKFWLAEKRAGRPLGRALGDEDKVNGDIRTVYQAFAGGTVMYDTVTGRCVACPRPWG